MKKTRHPLFIVAVVLAGLAGFAAATAGYSITSTSDIVAFEKQRVKALTGDNDAKMEVAKFYLTGTHVAENEEKGAKWVECAAEDGDEKAIGIMGFLHMGGIGVEQSFPKAREWLTKSGDPRAIELALTLQHFDRAMEILPPAERAEKTKANYEAARTDIRKALRDKLEAEKASPEKSPE